MEISCPICRLKKTNFFCEKNGFKLYNCSVCQLIFVWPIPVNLADIYQAAYFKSGSGAGQANQFGYTDYEEDKKVTRETFVIYLNEISKLTASRPARPTGGPAGGKIFDLGAASGYFLDIAREAGYETSGAEISGYAAKIARAKGHKIFLGDLLELNLEEKFDLITLWDVLEHLAEPVKYLKQINIILDQSGLLAINTIDSGSRWARFWGRNWQAILPPEHLFYFSQKSLKKCLRPERIMAILKPNGIPKWRLLFTA